MKKLVVFFSVLALVALMLQACQKDGTLPAESMQSGVFDPDMDDDVLGKAVGSSTCRGAIGNFVWADTDCDGELDCYNGTLMESGIPGVEVRLFDPAGNLLATTFTDSTGRYRFTHLCAGSYLVEVVPPAGYVLTTPNAIPDTMKDSNPNPSLVTITDQKPIDKSIDFGFCEMMEGEGCTPGYWKQEQHFDSWPAPYTPDMLFSDVFEDAFPGMTLVEVASTGGGGLEALGRHAVAAMLNAASDGVDYPLALDEVINMFNDVYPGTDDEYEALKDQFEYYNELGCPLD